MAVSLRYESLSLSVFVHNSAVPGSRCPLTLAVSTAAAAAAAFPTWLQLAGLTDRRRGGPTCPALLQGSPSGFYVRLQYIIYLYLHEIKPNLLPDSVQVKQGIMFLYKYIYTLPVYTCTRRSIHIYLFYSLFTSC